MPATAHTRTHTPTPTQQTHTPLRVLQYVMELCPFSRVVQFSEPAWQLRREAEREGDAAPQLTEAEAEAPEAPALAWIGRLLIQL